MAPYAFQTSKGFISYTMTMVENRTGSGYGPVIIIDDANKNLFCQLSSSNTSDMASLTSSLANALKAESSKPPPGYPPVDVDQAAADGWAEIRSSRLFAQWCKNTLLDGGDTAIVFNFSDAVGPVLGNVTITGAGDQLWSRRTVAFNSDEQVIADIRDYTSISNQWLANHAFPTTNLWQADENLATELSASVTRDAMHGGAIDYAAPNPIAYERQEDIFRLGSYDIDRHLSLSGIASVRLTDPSGLGSSFDISGSYFNGPRDFGIRVAFTPPVSLFDSMFNNMFGGLPPVVLDLDGDGVRIEPRTGSNVFFNADGDSAIERTSWVGSGDGLLAIDPDGDGKITKADEIAFANLTADPNDTDLEALATLYDANGDHKLDAADGVWGQLRVWVDGNRNAVTDGGELKTLAQLGISSISLISDRNTFTLPDGSRINGFGSFVRNGVTHTLADAVPPAVTLFADVFSAASYAVREVR